MRQLEMLARESGCSFRYPMARYSLMAYTWAGILLDQNRAAESVAYFEDAIRLGYPADKAYLKM